MKAYYQIRISIEGDWRSRVRAVRMINQIPEDAKAHVVYYQELDFTIIVFQYNRII